MPPGGRADSDTNADINANPKFVLYELVWVGANGDAKTDALLFKADEG